MIQMQRPPGSASFGSPTWTGRSPRSPGLGGEVLVAPHSVEFGSRFAIILDPTGGTIGLVQYLDTANPTTSPNP